MKRLSMVAALCVVLCSGVGCGGPNYLTNSMGDWYAEKYVESPWLWGNALSYMVYSMVYSFGYMADGFVNGYYFWALDAKPIGDNKGSSFDHKNAAGKKVN